MKTKIIGAALAAVLIASCGGERATRSASVDDATAEREATRMYDTAMRTMEKMGRVEHADPNQRLIYGVTRSGVVMEIEILMRPGLTPDLSVQASVPPGLPAGDIDEPERFMTLFREARK